ncbi:MAG TPA: TetR/AcrR family transcriptional regulator [Pseudonocardiaceae bacterium]|jgi:AcrR family transcriptional regulator|nr:TetR/AcrR family transcriptional regulator [Pseudonocardiaceae bacterium]
MAVRLTRSDWTAAALVALAEGGVGAVAIEPLAARLGATKGSAYWHFANREALLRATLERWEQESTESVIRQVEAQPEGHARLRALFESVLDHPTAHLAELALLSAPAEPVVTEIVNRVTERRIGYLAGLYGQIGFGRPEARRRAVLAYAAYLGNAQLRRAAPKSLPTARRPYVEDVVHALTRPPR